MKKRVLLLAVSCKNGGLCPGGIDLDNPSQWIRIVKDDGQSGAVQGIDIDFAQPLDVIEFNGQPRPQGKQLENWVITSSCRKVGTEPPSRVVQAYNEYGYHGFWDNLHAYLTEEELAETTYPSESIMRVRNARLYKNNFGKAKIDFNWAHWRYPIQGISMTDPDFYEKIADNPVQYNQAILVVSIPKSAEWQGRAYKFVSKVFVQDPDFSFQLTLRSLMGNPQRYPAYKVFSTPKPACDISSSSKASNHQYVEDEIPF